jgi:hypothetical protein
MAYQYTIGSPGTAILPLKCVIGLYNNLGSGRVIRIYNIWALNNQTAAVTGPVATTVQVHRVSELSGGIALNYLKHNTQNPNLPAQIVCATNPTIAFPATSLVRSYLWSTGEPAAAGIATYDELTTIPQLVKIYNANYYETNVEPLTCRNDEGIAVIMANIANGATTPVADFFIEFTVGTT